METPEKFNFSFTGEKANQKFVISNYFTSLLQTFSSSFFPLPIKIHNLNRIFHSIISQNKIGLPFFLTLNKKIPVMTYISVLSMQT